MNKIFILTLIFMSLLSCQNENRQTFSFNKTQFVNEKLEVTYVSEHRKDKIKFEITDSLTMNKILTEISQHSPKEYVDFMETNYSESYFDFNLKQIDNNEYIISTGIITKPGEKEKGFVYIFRKADIGFVPEGRYYDDELPELLHKILKK